MITSRYISNNTFQHGAVIANIGVDTAADGLPKGLKKRAAGSAGPLASFLEEALQLLGLLLRRPGALLHGPPELRSIGELFDLNASKNISDPRLFSEFRLNKPNQLMSPRAAELRITNIMTILNDV